jgi:hypothetical protein
MEAYLQPMDETKLPGYIRDTHPKVWVHRTPVVSRQAYEPDAKLLVILENSCATTPIGTPPCHLKLNP